MFNMLSATVPHDFKDKNCLEIFKPISEI